MEKYTYICTGRFNKHAHPHFLFNNTFIKISILIFIILKDHIFDYLCFCMLFKECRVVGVAIQAYYFQMKTNLFY